MRCHFCARRWHRTRRPRLTPSPCSRTGSDALVGILVVDKEEPRSKRGHGDACASTERWRRADGDARYLASPTLPLHRLIVVCTDRRARAREVCEAHMSLILKWFQVSTLQWDSATIGLFYRDLHLVGARWLTTTAASRWRPSKEKNDRKRGWRISAGRAPQYSSGLERAGKQCSEAAPMSVTRTCPPHRQAPPPARPVRELFGIRPTV